jgi:hypothetical protein
MATNLLVLAAFMMVLLIGFPAGMEIRSSLEMITRTMLPWPSTAHLARIVRSGYHARNTFEGSALFQR